LLFSDQKRCANTKREQIMPKGPPKNNAIRMLEAAKIKYEILSYSAEFHTAEEVAELINESPETVYKTLVVLPESGNGKPLLVIIPANKELNLKALGLAVGEKKLRMAMKREAESLTGLLIGGISPLALMQKKWPVYIYDQALTLEKIHVSAGQRGMNLRLDPKDLISVTGAITVKID